VRGVQRHMAKPSTDRVYIDACTQEVDSQSLSAEARSRLSDSGHLPPSTVR
jgi:hypothetical protein